LPPRLPREYGLAMRTKPNRLRHLRMLVQTTAAVALATLFSGLTTANAEQVALTHATIINPASSAVIHDGTLVIEGDHIAAVGLPNDTKIPQGARTIECTGKFILPGYIDT